MGVVATTGLRIDERVLHERPCQDCGRSFPHITGYVEDSAGVARAVYFASCHMHEANAARIDVSLGTSGVDPPADDHATFSCELRRDGAMLVDAPATLSDHPPVLGEMLTREAALAHAWVDDFWRVIDLVATDDPLVIDTVYAE